VAGLVTAAQQGEAAAFGFLNPVLYQLYGTGAFNRTLPLTRHSPARQRAEYCPAAVCGRAGLITFDDHNPSMIGYTRQVTLPGYDNMTGLGTPGGPRFSPLLRELARS
jgi:hypothetical protein